MPGMDRDRLERYLAEGLSLTEIGVLENRDPSTVGYWLKKYGLAASRPEHAAEGRYSTKRLEQLADRA